MRSRVLVATIAVLLAFTACSDDGGPADDPTVSSGATVTSGVSTVPATTTTRADEAGGIDPLDGAGTATVSAPATSTETALLTAVRAARHEGYDRVVFEFANVLPGYQVGYQARPVLADGSGDEVTVSGDQVVLFRFEHALDADLSQESAPRTYTGPDRLSPSTPEVVELVRIGGFEGVLTWVAGLRDRVDFRVSTLQAPPRVVIDFRNH